MHALLHSCAPNLTTLAPSPSDGRWSYEADIYIDIDQNFVDVAGNGNLTEAHRYVDLLISAASTIYEREVDTRITVAHIALTSLYDDQTDATDMLKWV